MCVTFDSLLWLFILLTTERCQNLSSPDSAALDWLTINRINFNNFAFEKRGKGDGSRQTFTLPAKNKTRVQFSSPGKTKYKTQKAVKRKLL